MGIAKGAAWTVVVLGFLAVIVGAAGVAVVGVAFMGGVIHTVSGG